jgi:nucleotidyltransferase/DNA polymerase involved in DNA repair
MQETVEAELGITVSIGLSITKVLAKIGSKHKKPHGLAISMSCQKCSGNIQFIMLQACRQKYRPSTREKEGMCHKE